MDAIVTRLKVICWIGALVDLFFAVAMIVPSLWGRLLGIADYSPGLQHRLDMGVGAALMLGWACLLVWAAQDPVRRRGVLALTIFPVLVGIGVAAALAIATGESSLKSLLWVFGMKALLLSLLTYGLLAARRIARTQS